MSHTFYVHSSVEGHLGSFQLLAITNKVAMNIVEHVSFLYVGESFGYLPRSGIAGSSGSTMSIFLRNHQTDFQSGCTSLQYHQQWRGVPLYPHPHQHLLSPEFLILAILTGVRWNIHGRSYKVRGWDGRKDHPETAPPGDPSHKQPPNPDTIAYASNILLTWPWYCEAMPMPSKYRSGCS